MTSEAFNVLPPQKRSSQQEWYSIYLALLGWTPGGGGVTPDVFIDSVNGNDANDGLTAATPKQTLSAGVTLIDSLGDGTVVSLIGNSVWRESFAPTPDNLVIAWDETGAPPVITAFDVQTGWTDDTGTVAGRWYKDVAHDSGGTNRQVVVRDDELMSRVASAAAVTTEGDYYSAGCGTANPIRVYINVGAENPNTSGSVYEVTTRNVAVFLQDGCTMEGFVALGAISNNGPVEGGFGTTFRRFATAYGTKHLGLIASGLVEDCVAIGVDNPTASEPGSTTFVAFAEDATGLSATFRRVFMQVATPTTSGIYAHTINDPTDSYQNIIIDQCIGEFGAGGVFSDASGVNVAMSNSAVFGDLATALFTPYGLSSADVQRCISITSVDSPVITNGTSGSSITASQLAILRSNSSGGIPALNLVAGSSIDITNVSLDTNGGNYSAAVGWSSGTTGSVSLLNSLLVANSPIIIASAGTYSGDDNTFGTRNIGPFGTWSDGNFYNLASNMAGWRTASSADAASTASVAPYFTGTTADGDFQQSGALAGAGVTEHWNFNTRAVVSTPPTRLPVIPQTLAEAVTYITDPTAWDFYP